ncbi:MAG: DUF11 domain-containing protein [Candidatus Roizmanbacteria bacterium]|nr:DUF11 domain-containing protein [Candidatus Roizmanbacteria bacterium]
MMNKTIFATTIALVMGIFIMNAPALVYADTAYGPYGQDITSGKVVVDKLVRHPVSGDYVDNLGLSDAKYGPEDAIFFKLIAKNTGGSTLSSIRVEDVLPSYVAFISGGDYNAATRVVSTTFTNVQPGTERTLVVQVRALPLAKLPAQKSVICPVNKVTAYTVEQGQDEDTAQFCIEKKARPQTVPATGDPFGIALALGSLPTLFAGWKLRKRSL